MSEVKQRKRPGTAKPPQVHQDGDQEEEEMPETAEKSHNLLPSLAEHWLNILSTMLKGLLMIVIIPPMMNWAALQREKSVLLNVTR